jgi:hypothetical protein
VLQDISQRLVFNVLESLDTISESIIFEERMTIPLRAEIVEFIDGRRCLKIRKMDGMLDVRYDIHIINDKQ